MPLVKVTKNYRITIPSKIRNALRIREGEYLRVELRGNEIVIRKINLEWPTIDLGRDFSPEDIEGIIRKVLSEVSNWETNHWPKAPGIKNF
ncbi:AbrB/MazE/SpoVT family DNA-binding domain-containing protein [Pyrococcus kukulkanii]|uniref:AbrB/MazE/SpoVT family DNA-binding domain-containing protein n=1 Tax=Pyrococcus kukulkanii TaxID=1609559 RepID=UPI00082D6C96|nr:AbrB/MazE/SpoVT family DNA-binding domain-containing protein [Pyrococcus kukulkanii]